MGSRHPDLTAERLRSRLDYSPTTGVFTWLVQPSSSATVGDPAGCLNTIGYIQISVDRRRFYAHRLAWLWMTGEWPAKEIDHINGIRNDNRWTNLRQADKTINNQNLRLRNDNPTGFRGVRQRSKSSWAASIRLNGKSIHIGCFSSPEEASSAYLAARALNFTSQPIPREFL